MAAMARLRTTVATLLLSALLLLLWPSMTTTATAATAAATLLADPAATPAYSVVFDTTPARADAPPRSSDAANAVRTIKKEAARAAHARTWRTHARRSQTRTVYSPPKTMRGAAHTE